MPSSDMTEFAGQSLGGYLLEEEIGRGSMGIVYRGKQPALGREVAVKILPRGFSRDPSSTMRFVREAHIIARLNHPQIVQIYDAGQHDDVLYFVMKYVQGPTVSGLLQLDDQIPQHLAAEYIAQVADALDTAYQECQIIHRSPLWTFILEHLPLALSWMMELRTVSDCDLLVQHYRSEYCDWYRRQLQNRLTREIVEVAKEVLIEHHRPCLNIVGNRQCHPLTQRNGAKSVLFLLVAPVFFGIKQHVIVL